MPKRLLIIIDEMEIGGSQRNIVDMARNINASAFSVSLVFFRNSSPYVDDLRKAGVEVTHIQKRWKVDPMFFLRLCLFIRRGNFDIIHAFSFSGELWGWLANMLTGNATFISTVHSVYEWYSSLQWTIKRWVTLDSAAVIANSQAGADYAALRTGIRRSTISVVQNGIQLPAPTTKTDAGETEQCQRRLLFVGRLVAHKNLGCLLQAFRLVVEKAPATCLDIVGDGPLRQSLEEHARQLEIDDRVIFHGEQSDVAPFLNDGGIFVMTSHREGLSNAIMEAMCLGLPVVASNVGGNPELVVHGHTGMLFPPDDHETLADTLLELLNDAGKCRSLSQNARAAAQRFHDPRRMTAEWEHIYERCLQEPDACAVRR